MVSAGGRGGLAVWMAMAGAAGVLVAAADRQQKIQRVPEELRGPLLYLPLTYTPTTLPVLRRLLRLLPGQPHAGVALRGQTVPAHPSTPDAPAVRVVVAERPDRPRRSPALLWLHGGGFILGAAGSPADEGPRLARDLNILVVSVDYRLAPEHPFPAALDDAHAALAWLHAHADELSIDPDRIAVGGDSAGGGLAAGLAQLATDRGEVPVAFQSLLYPMLDDRTVLREPPEGVGELVWTPASNHFAWASYLGAEPGTTTPPPYAAPARRVALGSLPPAWIGVGDRDLFHSEDVAYAERLREQGVDVTLDVVEGFYHSAGEVAPNAPLARRMYERQRAALRRGLGLPTP